MEAQEIIQDKVETPYTKRGVTNKGESADGMQIVPGYVWEEIFMSYRKGNSTK